VFNVSYLNHSTLQKFTGLKGFLVDIKDTIKGFNMIIDGELDHLPESAFNLKGTIEEAIEAGEKMLESLKQVGSFS
jgi:F-type H+-transporting ATPase subunit beta